MEKFIKTRGKKIVLISNIGSASRKYVVYEVDSQDHSSQELFTLNFDQKEFFPNIKLSEALYAFFEISKKKYSFSVSDIDILAERVVAVGEYFLEDKVIDKNYLLQLEKFKKYDTLHTESLLNELRQIFLIQEVCQHKKIRCRFKLIGISDSTFHKTIPKETYTYPILPQKASQEKIRKYGYHGISMSEVANTVKGKYQNLIAIHLGGGGSVTAIQKGESVYNSFGMTPVSGLINLTRSGDLDPLVVLEVLESQKKSFRFLSQENYLMENTQEVLYEKSGLFALTGERDMRDILENLQAKNREIREKNKFALDVYITRINEHVGQALAHLGQCDTLALTGSILEKSLVFRTMLLKKLAWLKLQPENILVLETREEAEMLRLLIQEKFL